MQIIPIMPIETLFGMVNRRAGYYIRCSPAAINARLDRSRLKAMSSPLLAFLRADPTIVMLMMPVSNPTYHAGTQELPVLRQS